MMQFGYSIAPTYINWTLREFVKTDKWQQAIVDRRLAEFLAWHRSTQLPEYAAFLDEVNQRLSPMTKASAGAGAPRVTGVVLQLGTQESGAAAGGLGPVRVAGAAAADGSSTDARPLSVAELNAWRTRAIAAFPPLLRSLAEPVAEFVVTLTPAQLADIERELASRNEDARDEYLVTDDRVGRERRVTRWRERLEANIGALTEKQQALLAARVNALPTGSSWWERRLARQQKAMAVLRELSATRPPLDQATRQVDALFRSWADPLGGDDQKRQEVQTQAVLSMMAELFEIAPPRQYQFAHDRFAGFAADLRAAAGISENRRASLESLVQLALH